MAANRYRVTVPTTSDMSVFSCISTDSSPMESVHENALWHYNRAREHDGLPPLLRLPFNTRYEILKEGQ